MSPDDIRRSLAAWGELWGTPELAREVRVRLSGRMVRTLGNYHPGRDEIRLGKHVYEAGGRELLLEVLCHEAAHAAIRRLHPKGVRPHGPEWKALMTRAGYPPRARLPLTGDLADVVQAKRLLRHGRPVNPALRSKSWLRNLLQGRGRT